MGQRENGTHPGAKRGRRPYRKPELKRLGAVETMTAGGSNRANEGNRGTANYKKLKP